jgi:thiamine-phosphate pyrophosphorylase
MAKPRLFLVAPEAPADRLIACLEVACAAGDVASLLVGAAAPPELVALAQARGVAVLANGAPLAGADGVQVDAGEVADARRKMGKDAIVGAMAGASRHLALEAAEAGADYVALSQTGPTLGGEPIVGWWSDLVEIPCVAFDPTEPADLDILLPQNPDFIRPSDAMWESAEEAHRIITAIMERISRS